MIEFYGDSFSASSNGWPSMLATKLSLDYVNRSRAATSVTEAITSLQAKESFGDIVCVTVSSPDRIYHPDYLIHLSLKGDLPSIVLRDPINTASSKFIKSIKEIETAVKYYMTYLENDVNRSIRYECQFNWLLNLTNKHPNTKFILIPCFEHCDIIVDNFNAVITTPPLADTWRSNGDNPYEVNHLTLKQNKQFADQVYELLLNYDANKSKTVEISFK